MPKNAAPDLLQPVRHRSGVSLARSGVPAAKPPHLRIARAEPTRIVPIYWDAHFRRSPIDVVVLDEFLKALFRSSWMAALHDRGVAPALLLPSFVPNDRAPLALTASQLKQRLLEWIGAGLVGPKPKRVEVAPTYLVFTPLGTELPGVTSRTGDDLSYAVVPLVSTGAELLEVHSRPICEELSRALLAAQRRA